MLIQMSFHPDNNKMKVQTLLNYNIWYKNGHIQHAGDICHLIPMETLDKHLNQLFIGIAGNHLKKTVKLNVRKVGNT